MKPTTDTLHTTRNRAGLLLHLSSPKASGKIDHAFPNVLWTFCVNLSIAVKRHFTRFSAPSSSRVENVVTLRVLRERGSPAREAGGVRTGYEHHVRKKSCICDDYIFKAARHASVFRGTGTFRAWGRRGRSPRPTTAGNPKRPFLQRRSQRLAACPVRIR